MKIAPFVFSGVPEIIFGQGRFSELTGHILSFGNNVLLVTGGSSLKSSGKLDILTAGLVHNSIDCHIVAVKSEPSPDLVDEAVGEFASGNIDVVVSIGGGSVIDAGKAISAMLPLKEPVTDYLESVGAGKTHSGEKVPFIAVPTTSGTGSEATKNAVLSRVGINGFKKSLRHNNFVPDIAILDPELMMTCPPGITAASGLDAFTQLLGSYVSVKSSPITDSLALGGLNLIKDCLIPVCTTGSNDPELRAGMAYAAMVSGITLANAGLGIVHGLASTIGGLFEIPHGVICGTLVGEAIKINVESLLNTGDRIYINKYANLGALFYGSGDAANVEKKCGLLVKIVEKWVDDLKIPRLGSFGITEVDIDNFIKASNNKNNPVDLTPVQVKELLLRRL